MLSGRYTAERFHARGGMGEVWLAADGEIGRLVALKKLRPERVTEKDRFLAEAQIQGQLEHPGIVPVHDLGVDHDGQPFYIMKFVHGRTLKDAVEEYHSPEAASAEPREVRLLQLLQTFVALCQAIAYAHSRGVIHRDLKPDNVMLGPFGETLVLDWGLSKVLGSPDQPGDSSYVHLSYSGESAATEAGAVMGAPPYMAPEVAEGKAVEADERTDVYLLGGTLYEILTGKPPRQGSSRQEMIELARTVPPVPPRQRNRQVPVALEAICLKAMARRKQDRYPSALALAEDVQRYLAGEPVSAYRETVWQRAGRWARRHRKGIGWAALILLVLGLAGYGFALVRQAEERRQDAQLEAKRLQRRSQARRDVKEFRRLAGDMHFHAISTTPLAGQAPAHDARQAERAAQAALALAGHWGSELEKLPLEQEREALKTELHNLLLLLVQLKSRLAPGPREAAELLALLERARPLGQPGRTFYELRAQCHRLVHDEDRAAADQRRAGRTPATALDHFLAGEKRLAEVAVAANVPADPALRTTRSDKLRDLIRQAAREFEAALLLDPRDYWSRLEWGLCSLSLGNTRQAGTLLDGCVGLRLRAPWAYSARGMARALGKQWKAAHRDLDRALALQPDFAAGRLNRGQVYWLEKNYAEALRDFTALLEAPPAKRLIQAAYYRGLVHSERGAYPEALADFRQVIAHAAADFRPVYLARARVYLLRGESAQALSDLNRFLMGPQFDPESPEAASQRGRLLEGQLPAWKLPPAVRQKTLRLALEQFQEALKRGGPSVQRLDDLGLVHEDLGQHREAVRAYSEALKREPENVKLLNKRGMLYVLLKNNDQAQADFAALLRHDPGNAEAHSLLGYVRACQNAPADAQDAAAQALLNAEGVRKYLVLHNVACIYAELSRSDKQREKAHQDLAITLFHRAVDLWRQGGEKGLNEIELIRDELKAFPPSLQARPELKELLGDRTG
jgi:tetratricopeptide (TPR) repeat protein/tRNA A-37 threonylcarbamoyl transferase component Bud32